MPLTTDTSAATETLGQVEKIFASFSWTKFAMLIALIAACIAVVRILLKLADRAMLRTKMDHAVQTFLRSGLKVILILISLCVVLGYLDVPMTSLVALLSVLGLAISLAIQGTLSNLAGGIMLLTAHPFTAGDYVEAGGVSGTITEVGLVYTKINTPDNKVIFVPNGDISSKTIINYTAEGKRRVDLEFTVSYDASPELVKECILRAIAATGGVHREPEPFVRTSAYNDSSIGYTVRVWSDTGDYWNVYFDLMEGVKREFDASGVEMTYPHVNVHMVRE